MFIIFIVIHIFSLFNTFFLSLFIIITGVTVCLYSASRLYAIRFFFLYVLSFCIIIMININITIIIIII